MQRTFDIAYRVAVVALLGCLVWMVHREGERIVAGLWSPSEPLQVEVTNDSSDAIPVQIQQKEAADPIQSIRQAAETARMQSQFQGWKNGDIEARAAANHLSVEDQKRFDTLYGTQPAPAASH